MQIRLEYNVMTDLNFPQALIVSLMSRCVVRSRGEAQQRADLTDNMLTDLSLSRPHCLPHAPVVSSGVGVQHSSVQT